LKFEKVKKYNILYEKIIILLCHNDPQSHNIHIFGGITFQNLILNKLLQFQYFFLYFFTTAMDLKDEII